MSLTTRRPVRMAGAVLNSGAPNTGEVAFQNGGIQTATMWSGNLLTNASLTGCPAGAVTSGGHTMLWSGAGRLHRILVHDMLTSGQQVTFYDSATIAPSGISVSGQRFIGRIPARAPATLALASGEVDQQRQWQTVIEMQMPFTSGLSVGAASGAPGFTVSFTPESVPTSTGN